MRLVELWLGAVEDRGGGESGKSRARTYLSNSSIANDLGVERKGRRVSGKKQKGRRAPRRVDEAREKRRLTTHLMVCIAGGFARVLVGGRGRLDAWVDAQRRRAVHEKREGSVSASEVLVDTRLLVDNAVPLRPTRARPRRHGEPLVVSATRPRKGRQQLFGARIRPLRVSL